MAVETVERLQPCILVLVHVGVESETIIALDELGQVLLEQNVDDLVLVFSRQDNVSIRMDDTFHIKLRLEEIKHVESRPVNFLPDRLEVAPVSPE